MPLGGLMAPLSALGEQWCCSRQGRFGGADHSAMRRYHSGEARCRFLSGVERTVDPCRRRQVR